MILSWRHRFLFVKTVKTAGTSLEVDLAPLLEDEAIVTRIQPAAPGHVQRNTSHPMGDFFNHISAREIRERIGAEAFDSLFKFCVEREPVAKCLSHFHMRKRSEKTAQRFANTSWDDYCRAGKFPIDLTRYSEATEGGPRLLVDRVLAFETLEETLPALFNGLGIKDFVLRSRQKAEYSHQRILGPDDVTDEQRRLIYQAFKPSLEVHGLYAIPAGL